MIGADTVVLTHPPRGAEADSLPGWRPTVLEKPQDKEDQLRMLLDFNGGLAEVVTGVAVVWPVLVAPGWQVKCVKCISFMPFVFSSGFCHLCFGRPLLRSLARAWPKGPFSESPDRQAQTTL